VLRYKLPGENMSIQSLSTRLRRLLLGSLIIAAASPLALSQANPLGLAAHHITASVADIDRAVAWYQDVLGFTLSKRGSRQNGAFQFAELTIPGFGISLVHLKGDNITPSTKSPDRPQWVHIAFTVPRPDVAFKLLRARGADAYTRDLVSNAPLTSFLLHDSEGNEIEIISATAN
jgi:catechol 2,3-dioxygenase-like lactoylglutathione lyase family enzyme